MDGEERRVPQMIRAPLNLSPSERPPLCRQCFSGEQFPDFFPIDRTRELDAIGVDPTRPPRRTIILPEYGQPGRPDHARDRLPVPARPIVGTHHRRLAH